MTRTLEGTTSAAVAKALAAERRAAGAVTVGLVLTFVVVVVDAERADESMAAARSASMAHPCRVIAVVLGDREGSARLDAEVTFGGTSGPGEAVLLRLSGPLVDHADSVVLPLLAPDTPVVTWWAGAPPDDPAGEPLGQLASRRVTDTYRAADPLASLLQRARLYQDGDTDLSWTRDTLWRSIIAAVSDSSPDRLTGAAIVAEAGNPSAALLAGWILDRTDVLPAIEDGPGPAITEVRLTTDGEGGPRELRLTRPDGHTAVLSGGGRADRTLPLPIRPLSDLLAEELARLNSDEIYAGALAAVERLPR